MREKEYQQLRDKIKRDYKKNLDSLEIVWSLVKQNSPRKTLGLAEATREVVAVMPGDFNIGDVDLALQSSFPNLPHPLKRASLSSILNRLKIAECIAVVNLGKGRRATVFKTASGACKS